MTTNLDRALTQWDAHAFAKKHGGKKESASPRSYEWLYTCPICASGRLRYNSGKHTFICWGCGISGSTVFLVQLLERCTDEGAIEYILRGYIGGDSRIDKLDSIIRPTQSGSAVLQGGHLRRLPPIRWPKGVEQLTEPCAPHWRAWDYLTRVRGLNVDQIHTYGIGFGRQGRLENYIVFPIYMQHALVYWQGRATWDPPAHLTKEDRKKWVDETKYRKTLNPYAKEGSEAATGHEVIFNYDRARAAQHVVICEGPVDAIKVGPHAVAMLGKGETTGTKVELLAQMSAQRYTVYLDRGEKERIAARRIASELEPFARVFICEPPEGYDPGKLTPEQNAHIISNATPFRSDLLTSPL